MRQVQQYSIYVGSQETHVMAYAGPVVFCALANGAPTVWIDADLASSTHRRVFLLASTYVEVPRDAKHVGSFADSGGYVWHCFERTVP